MGKRRRINTSVEDALYQRLQRIKAKYGFRNVCELNVALLNILASHVEAAESRPTEYTANVSEEIDEMFNDLGSWERVPDGNVPKRGHRTNDI